MRTEEFPAGTVIFRAGGASACAYRILKGTVELVGPNDRAPARLVELGPGEVFGEMSLIEERPRSLTARAVTDVELSSMTSEDFENLLISDPAAIRIYLKKLFERLRMLSSRAEAIPLSAETMAARSSKPSKTPIVTIHPLSRRAAATLPIEGLKLVRFPFRIGRASSEHEDGPVDVNELWLVDQAPFNVSRHHAAIEFKSPDVAIEDRGSRLGIYVNDTHIGGSNPLRHATLEDGDNVVVLGVRTSPYQFRIHVER
ncbi:MAG TPA: cyclic nucleotide-binding domain-containing protein [Gemmataceae bacterium]|jgi:CRP-like cAMP-binding protein|nr:cyclic nucleotide-binding domain-containing protein [Gemmataceae bacterium]